MTSKLIVVEENEETVGYFVNGELVVRATYDRLGWCGMEEISNTFERLVELGVLEYDDTN